MSELNLVHDAPASFGAGGPGPKLPTLIPQGFTKPLQFTDIDALARHIQRQRGRKGLRLIKGVASYGGSDTFPCFRVSWIEPEDGGERYAFTVAVQDKSQEALQAAIAAANPHQPR